jgi:hypothetical protein
MGLWDWNPDSTPDAGAKAVGSRVRALEAVRRAVAQPGQLTDALYDFLESDRSQFAWLFWRLVGTLDPNGGLRSEIERRALTSAFSWYMAGRSQVDSAGVDESLDRMADDPSDAEKAFAATWRMEPTVRGARRLAKLARGGHVPRRKMASWLVSGAWLTRIPEDLALEVLEPIAEDPEAKGSSEVIAVLDRFFHGNVDGPSGTVRDLAWRMLEAAPAASVAESWSHQVLATRLVERGDGDRGFLFFERVLSSAEGRFGWEDRELVRSDLGQALAALNRDRMVDLILGTVITKWNPYSGLTGGSGVGVIDPARDADAIMKAVDGQIQRVRPILSLFSGTEPGFLELAVRLTERFDKDDDLWSSLAFCFGFGTVIMGSGAEHPARRIRQLEGFRESGRPGPRGAEWLRWTRAFLERRRAVDEEWEWVRSFWDGKGTAADVTSLLDKDQEDGTRRWFVRRLLENEKRGLALKILGPAEVRYALEHDAELTPATRREWEALLRRRSPAWKS